MSADDKSKPPSLFSRLFGSSGSSSGKITAPPDPRRSEEWAARVAEGQALLPSGGFAQAKMIAQQVLRDDPGNVGALALVADVAFRNGATQDAIEILKEGLTRATGSPLLHFKLGCLYEDANDHEAAIAEYQRALALDPDYAKAHNNLGSMRVVTGDLDGALVSFKRAYELDPSFWLALNNLGLCYKLQGRFVESASAFLEAMRGRRTGAPKPSEVFVQDLMTSHPKLIHDIEQLEYLVGRGILGDEGRRAIDALRQGMDSLGAPTIPVAPVTFSEAVRPVVAPYYNRLLHLHEAPALPGGAINPDLDWPSMERSYFARAPGMTFIDDFLRPEAVASLRRFCLESTIWFDAQYTGGYIGNTFENGFICPLLVQIAEEFRLALPGVMGNNRITGLWGYKYDSERSGISPHADYAAVNVNFWITPDESNLEPGSGGLVVWDKEAPLEWDFDDYNDNPALIQDFIESTGAKPFVIPHRQNRVVLFNSDLFHKTDSFRFKTGYEHRRINVTMLYGDRQKPG